LKLTFLGTGTSQGVPVIACECEVCLSNDSRDKRLRTSVLFEVNGYQFVIDSGPDFRQQMLTTKVQQLDALIFTHHHKDHTAGLDDVRAFNFKQKSAIDIYGSRDTIRAIKEEFSYIFSEHDYPGIPQLDIHLIDNHEFEIKGVNIVPIQVWHYKMPVFGFRIGDITYITDANRIDDPEKEKIRNSKVLVLNALRKSKHISHFNLDEALQMIEELAPEKAYLIHLSHQMGKHRNISRELPENVFIATDNMTVVL